MKWGDRYRDCDVALGYYYWPSGDSSGGSSASSLDYVWLWITENMESETADKGGICYTLKQNLPEVWQPHFRWEFQIQNILHSPFESSLVHGPRMYLFFFFIKTDYHLFSELSETKLKFQISWPDIEQWPVLTVQSTAICKVAPWPLMFCRAGLCSLLHYSVTLSFIEMCKTNAE